MVTKTTVTIKNQVEKPSKMSGLNFIHGDLYSVALEVTKKFVSQNERRPVLTYAQHTEDGDIVATDSHRMIRIRDIHSFDGEYLINPNSFTFAKGNYPDTKNMVNRDSYTESIVLSREQIRLWLQLFKSMNQTLRIMKDHRGDAKMHFKENHIEIELSIHKIFIQLPHELYTKPEMKIVAFNVQYMRDALEAHFKLASEELTFYFNGPMKPIIIDDNVSVTTLVLPVRLG